MILRTIIALTYVSIAAAQWQWAHLSGDLENVAYDATPENGGQPPADSRANVWATAGGDFWVLRNRRDATETEMWRWAGAESKWMLMMSSQQDAMIFEPPPKPDNYGQETDPELLSALDEYELAERREAERRAKEKAEENLKSVERQETTSVALQPAKASGKLPQARLYAATASDVEGGRLFMFGGRGGISRARGDQLWMYEITEGRWTLLSGRNIDYSTKLCSIFDRRKQPENGPCVISSSVGHDSLVYFEGRLYLVAQERDGNQYRIVVWCFDVDGSRKWTFLGVAGDQGPAATTFSVPMRSYAHASSLYIYRSLQVVGQSGAVVGEIWSFDTQSKKWEIKARPAVPLENTATWVVDGLLITHMPGDMLAGVGGKREVPDVDGWWKNADEDRMVVFDFASGKYAAIQKQGINGVKTNAAKKGEFAEWSAPGRRFAGVHTYGMADSGEASLFMYAGSLVYKRNPDQRNDLWQCKLDIGKLREQAGF